MSLASEKPMETDRSSLEEVNYSILNKSVMLLVANLKSTLLIIFLSLIACSVKSLAFAIPVDPLILQSLAMPFATFTTIADYFYFPRSDYSVTAALALTISHLTFFLPIVTTIHYVSLCCSKEKTATTEELPSGIISSSAASFFTRLCVTLLDLVPKFLLLALAKVATLSDFPMSFLAAAVVGISWIFQLYLRSVWLLALAASAVESRWGLSAVRKALELVHGKQRQVLSLGFTWFYVAENFLLLVFGRPAGKTIAFDVIEVVVVAMLGVVSLAAHVVLYYDLNKRCGDDQAGAAEEYNVLPADDPSARMHT